MNRQDAQALLKRLREFNSDYATMLEQADMVFQMATNGFDTEVAGKEGAISIRQVAPAISVQANMLKRNLVKDIIEYANQEEKEDVKIELTVNVSSLEATL